MINWNIILALLLFILSIGDLRYGLLFDWLNVLLLVVGVVYILATGKSLSILCGAIVGAGFLLFVRVLTHGGLGLGDVKFMGALGVWLGAKGTLVALFLAFFSGGIVALLLLALRRATKRQAIPFGPFLALGGGLAFFFGEEIWQWYEAIL